VRTARTGRAREPDMGAGWVKLWGRMSQRTGVAANWARGGIAVQSRGLNVVTVAVPTVGDPARPCPACGFARARGVFTISSCGPNKTQRGVSVAALTHEGGGGNEPYGMAIWHYSRPSFWCAAHRLGGPALVGDAGF